MINLAKKIEQIQKKPEHERRKIFWITISFLVPAIFIFGIWMILLNFSNKEKNYPRISLDVNINSNVNSNSISNIDSPENLLNNSKNLLQNLQGMINETASSSKNILQDSGASFSPAPPVVSEENKVYFVSPAPSM